MDAGQFRGTLMEFHKTLFSEGFLDSQFTQLQQLQDESNPNFVVEVVSLFFDDSERLLNDLTRSLQDQRNVDFRKVDAHVHQLKGSSSSIGAQRVKNACNSFRQFCEDQNYDGCLKCLKEVKYEFYSVKGKLEYLFMMEQQLQGITGSMHTMG